MKNIILLLGLLLISVAVFSQPPNPVIGTTSDTVEHIYDNDKDGLSDEVDTDDDNDGVLDKNDAFPFDYSESVDTDGDGIGDNADVDDDNDGVLDDNDAFPLDYQESVDTDGDGIGNNEDTDDDNDGIADSEDATPLEKSATTSNDQVAASQYKVYPNPTVEIIQVANLDVYNQFFLIVDNNGRQVMSGTIESGSINVSALQEGVYYLKIENSLIRFVKF